MFSEAVFDHFHHPRNSGELSGASAVAEVSNPVCGDVLRLAVRVTDGCIAEVRFKAQGCVTAIASASALTEMMRGAPLQDLPAITAEQIASALGGLPPATIHGSQLAAAALRELLGRLHETP
jgi:nitrogen fixation protein NifU and related proteins